MLPDVKEIYGQVTVEDVKRNLADLLSIMIMGK